jgi:hypothetical protein
VFGDALRQHFPGLYRKGRDDPGEEAPTPAQMMAQEGRRDDFVIDNRTFYPVLCVSLPICKKE